MRRYRFFALFCTNHWIAILTTIIGGAIGVSVWQKSDAGRASMDRFKLRLPLVGGIVHDYCQNRFTRTLGTVVAGGIPLVTSMELAARAVGNAHFERELLGVAVKVREGQALWESLEKTGLMSDIAVEMIKVGESTGSLEEMLTNTSDFTDEEIDYRLSRVVVLVEPLMLIIMAVIVGGMLLAIYYPLLQAYSQSRM